MMRMTLMGAVLAVLSLSVGCGDDAPFCEDIEQAVEHVRSGLGDCTANSTNGEPLAFSRSTCDDRMESTCDSGDEVAIEQYVVCLRSVSECNPSRQAEFDDAIDDCLDTFQNSNANGECIELVVGD